MKGTEGVRTVLLVYDHNDTATHRDEIRMRHVKTATVRKMNDKGAKIRSQAIPNWLEV